MTPLALYLWFLAKITYFGALTTNPSAGESGFLSVPRHLVSPVISDGHEAKDTNFTEPMLGNDHTQVL
jgi:hypothetical protein